MASPEVSAWHLRPGDAITRTVLHDQYGGSRQGGISPSVKTSNVLIFTDAASGRQHGYFDEWHGDTLFYTGEGQRGDQEMIKGNRAILDHLSQARALRLFEGSRATVQYVGEMELGTPAWEWGYAPETGGGPVRKVIRFHLQPRRVETPLPPRKNREYRHANENPATSSAGPFSVDPNQVDRALAAHARTQNALRDFLAAHGTEAWSPGPDEPDFDLAWSRRGHLYVAEVKSLTHVNEPAQLRFGLG